MEYPFKDLMPLDEVLEREGYYKDWTHLDPEVFYSLTQISEYIKTKGYGVDVRLLIAQLAEHFGLKTTQVVDLANLLQQKFANLEGVTQRFTNNINSLVAQMEAEKDAVIANATVDSEVILARGGKPTLQARLDEMIELEEVSTLNKSLYDHHSNITTKQVIIDDFETFGQAKTGHKWTVDVGGFKSVEGGLQGTEPGVWNKAWIETGLKDKEIELVARTLDGSSIDTSLRIIFRYEDSDNFYYVGHTSLNKKTYWTRTVVDGIAGDPVYTIDITPTTLIKIKIIGNTIEMYVNGELQYTGTVGNEFSDSTKVGISLYGNTGAISGFRVNELPKFEYPRNIIASVDNHMVSYDGNNLLYSNNSGANFMRGLNISQIGALKYIHLFSNGNILFADDYKCYYSHNWDSYQESTLLNEDGSPFKAKTVDTFYCHKRPSHKHIVNGKEMVVWGNYSITSGVAFTDNIRAWYTTDYGATVKCCYTANTPSSVSCRHIHNVDYYSGGNYFIMQTGDESSGDKDMSHWVKGIYHDTTDTWTWEIIGSGLDFKSTNIFFHSDGYAYYSWDLTPGGIRKAPIETLSDPSTHTLLFNTQRDCGYVLVGSQGDILAFQTSGTSNAWRYYYSADQTKFHLIPGDYPPQFLESSRRQYNCIWPPDGNGKILAGVQSMIGYPHHVNYFTRKEGHVWIDEQLSKFGFPNAMK